MNLRSSFAALAASFVLAVVIGCGGGGLPQDTSDAAADPGAGADAGMTADPAMTPGEAPVEADAESTEESSN